MGQQSKAKHKAILLKLREQWLARNWPKTVGRSVHRLDCRELYIPKAESGADPAQTPTSMLLQSLVTFNDRDQ